MKKLLCILVFISVYLGCYSQTKPTNPEFKIEQSPYNKIWGFNKLDSSQWGYSSWSGWQKYLIAKKVQSKIDSLALAASDTLAYYLLKSGGTMTGGITNNTSVNPLTTLAESWIGPSATAGIYFKGGKYGFGINDPMNVVHINHVGSNTFPLVIGDYNTFSSNTGIYLRTLGVAYISTVVGGQIHLGNNSDNSKGIRINSNYDVGIGTSLITAIGVNIRTLQISSSNDEISSGGGIRLGTSAGNKANIYTYGNDLNIGATGGNTLITKGYLVLGGLATNTGGESGRFRGTVTGSATYTDLIVSNYVSDATVGNRYVTLNVFDHNPTSRALVLQSTGGYVGIATVPVNIFDVKGAVFTGSYSSVAGVRFHDNVYGVNLGGIDASTIGVVQGSAYGVGAANIALQPNGGYVGIRNNAPTELLTLGTAGTTAGKYSMAGLTSGKTIFDVPAVAGNNTLTAPATVSGSIAVISQTINDAALQTSPSEDALFHALAGKEASLTKGTFTENIDGLVLSDSTRQVIGGATVLSVKSGRVIPTSTNISHGETAYGWGNWASNFGSTTGKITQGDDSRLSDARTPLSHTHGNITNAGYIGTTATLPIITGVDGILQAGSFGTTSGTFVEGRTFGTAANNNTGDFVAKADSSGVAPGSYTTGKDFQVGLAAKLDTTKATYALRANWNEAYSNMAKVGVQGQSAAILNSNDFVWVTGSPPLINLNYEAPTSGGTRPVTSGSVYTALGAKQDSVHVTASMALESNNLGHVVASSTISATELGYLNNATGNIQEQFTNKANINGVGSEDFTALTFYGDSLVLTGGINGTTANFSGLVKGSECERGSSRLLKTNIIPFVGSALDMLMRTDIYTYNLKVDGSFGIGFIAEDTHPWLSGKDQKSHLMGNHLGLLTKAIQEQQQEIDDLKQRIVNLEKVVNSLLNTRK